MFTLHVDHWFPKLHMGSQAFVFLLGVRILTRNTLLFLKIIISCISLKTIWKYYDICAFVLSLHPAIDRCCSHVWCSGINWYSFIVIHHKIFFFLFLIIILQPYISPVSSALGHVPSPSPSICDRPDGRQRQRKELHRQAAGGFGGSPDRLRQAGPWGVPAWHSGLSQSAGRIWVRWGNI